MYPDYAGNYLEEAHPLKQGLKPDYSITYDFVPNILEEAHPLKQGLKLF